MSWFAHIFLQKKHMHMVHVPIVYALLRNFLDF